jgi:hypothetical protein
MLNYFMCVFWPLLIFGTIVTYRMGKKLLGKRFWLMPLAFVFFLFLGMWWIANYVFPYYTGWYWWLILISPVFST